MKVAVYGDSYADTKNVVTETSWISFLRRNLANDYGDVSIDNYGKGGSSLYFSYTNFVETNHKYDLVIFLATEPHRYPIAFKPAKLGREMYITSVPHVVKIEKSYSHLFSAEEKLFLKNLKGWFDASNQDFNTEVAEIILDNVERLHPNVVIYPCFTQSFKAERFKKYKLDQYLHPLHSFWHRQLELLGIEPDDFTAMEKNTITGHMTPEFNEYIAKVLYAKIKTGKWDHTGFFDIKIEMPKTHYYKNWD